MRQSHSDNASVETNPAILPYPTTQRPKFGVPKLIEQFWEFFLTVINHHFGEKCGDLYSVRYQVSH